MSDSESEHPTPDAAALSRLRIVLVGAQHPGNIGAAARAMKVMGLSDLALVAPERYPDAEATARASGADDVLAAARVYDSLDEAVADCVLTIGTSARTRRTQWPLIDARDAATRAVAATVNGPVALVFGRERSGLNNAELDRCQLHLQVPTNPEYSSLNLAAAVQVVAYELRVASGHGIAASPAHEPVPAADMEGLFQHWHDVLVAAGFLDPDEPRILMRRLRRLFNRAAPDRIETNILRGALRALDPRGLPNRQASPSSQKKTKKQPPSASGD
ncbi:RNA methyltransferase [Salinisphaera hydrothermalis]|uniref:tRNA (cytidine/uridine-2'-O-)-methyltransferase TrmJ n=1 Tax=Salinisphaera hydrothermalis (strain C41B8) TaxID=1304275 RepID=A0A084IGK3_SALHC|nr:RNA methyltransferase [Salinisphaera hydrothermalis]KEZ75837.1 RNA methyltransferase [Salinisphaera hydrothermalis C41B8]